MNDQPSLRYLGATGVATLCAVLGVWLPWVSKQPAFVTDEGVKAYTTEGVRWLEAGIGNAYGLDWAILFLVCLVLGATLITRYVDRRPDLLHIVVGGYLLFISTGQLHTFMTATQVGGYNIQLGLIFLLISGILFVTIGVGGLLTHSLNVTLDLKRNGHPIKMGDILP
jgi:hypothetical protein